MKNRNKIKKQQKNKSTNNQPNNEQQLDLLKKKLIAAIIIGSNNTEVVRICTEIIKHPFFKSDKKEEQVLPYNNRGAAYYEQGMFAESIADCDKAIELNPGYAAAYFNRGNAYRKQGKFDLAIADYNKSNELKPDAQTDIGLGNAYADKGISLNEPDQTACFTKAMKFFCTAIEKYSNFEEAYRNLGLFLTEHRDHKTGKYQHNLTTDQRKNVEDGLEGKKPTRLGTFYLYSYLASTSEDEQKQYWSNRAKTFFEKVHFHPELLGNKSIDEPTTLYRFKPLDEHVFTELVLKKLFLNDPTQWNDPFDGRMFAPFRVPEYQEHFKYLRMQSFCVEREFPKDPLNNFLMWSHYADEHQGVCLVYGYQQPNEAAAFLHPVKYKSQPDLQDIHDFYLMKSEQWRYENEYRLVHMMKKDDAKLKEPCLLDYKDIGLTLKAICFGAECSITRIKMVKAFIKEIGLEGKIDLYQMKNDGVKFVLDHEEIKKDE